MYVYIAKDSEKNKIKKIPRVTDEGWNSQKPLSVPVEKKKKEKNSLQDLYLHPKVSPGLVPYMFFIASRKMVYGIFIGIRKL